MKKRNLFMSTTLMCGCLCLAFNFDQHGVYWLWSDLKQVAVILGLLTIILGVKWYIASSKISRTTPG
ncbi:MAG: hypothetical protein WBP41_18390 [Saprospiraceae bacterium]